MFFVDRDRGGSESECRMLAQAAKLDAKGEVAWRSPSRCYSGSR